MQKIVLREKKYYDIEVDGREIKVKILGDSEKVELMEEYAKMENFSNKLDEKINELKDNGNVKEYLTFSKKMFSEITEKQIKLLQFMLSEEEAKYFVNEYKDIEIIDRLLASLILEVQKINVEKRKEFVKKIQKEVK